MSSSLHKKKIGSIFDREEDESVNARRMQQQKIQLEKRREITRMKSMPATSAIDARNKFNKLDSNAGGKKLSRTPSAIVPQANNIKARLLRWATIKTNKYP